MSIWEELKRRNVVRVGIAYLALAWLLIEVATTVLPLFAISDAVLQGLIITLGVGFVIAIVLAWIYELTPQGVKRTEDLSDPDSAPTGFDRKLDFAIIAVLALALTLVVVDQYYLDSRARFDTVAVLPFVNLSGDPEQEYFADGMTDALITNLGKIESLNVISRTSIMRFKNSERSLPQIANTLGASAIVEATAQRVGNRVQITANLVDGVNDRQLWGDMFEEDFTDVLRLQSNLARAIANSIQATITPQEAERLASSQQVDAAAYDAYLRGWSHLYRMAPLEFDQAEEYFRLTRQLDPESALGHAGLAFVWSARAQTENTPAMVAAPLIRAFAEQAELIEPESPEAQRALSAAAYYSWDLDTAEFHARRAIELQPGEANNYFFLSNLRIIAGDTDEALQHINEAIALDPLNPLYRMFRGVIFIGARRYQESIDAFGEAVEMAPYLAMAWNNMTAALHYAGRYEEALDSTREWLRLRQNTAALTALEEAAQALGYTAAMLAVAQVLEQQALEIGGDSTNIARMYNRGGDQDKVLEWWIRAYDMRSPNALMYRAVELDGIRDD
ncbi:MAG: hypothetical protein RL120_12355, partial [Gammaproteobacteria bacterium]